MKVETLQWSVWLVDLDPVVGSEQAGRRPVVIVSREAANLSLPVVTVLPLTSRKPGRKIYPNEAVIPAGAGNLSKESVAMAHQLRTLSKRRLSQCLGTLDDSDIRDEIRASLRIQLEI